MQKYCFEECQAEAKRLRKKRQQDLINGIEPIMDLQHQEYLTFSEELSWTHRCAMMANRLCRARKKQGYGR